MATATPRRKLRRWCARLLLLGASLSVCLLLIEMLVRLFLPFYSPRNQIILHYNAEGLCFGKPLTTFKSGTVKGDYLMDVTFNRHGLRDTKDFTQSTTNDLFVLGDSFAFGWGVAEGERYSNLLEKGLHAPVYNLGIPGNLRDYQSRLRFVEQRGARVRHLVFGICMENDLANYEHLEATPAHRKMSWKRRLTNWVREHSALVTFTSFTLQRHEFTRSLLERLGLATSIDSMTLKNDFDPEVLASSRNEVLKIATNYHALVLIVPSRALWYGHNTVIEERVHERFVQMLREAGLMVVDAKPALEKAGRPLSCYFTTDPHWNSQGHALAAESIIEGMARNDQWQERFPGSVGAFGAGPRQ